MERKVFKKPQHEFVTSLGNGVGRKIYLGRSCNTNSPLVIVKEQSKVESYENEVRILLAVQNLPDYQEQRIIKYIDSYVVIPRVKVTYYLITEHIPGDDLQVHSKITRDVSYSDFEIFRNQMFSAVKWLHSHGIAHRDIKMENIIYQPLSQSFTLIDFGSGLIAGDPHVNDGTNGYISPELINWIKMLRENEHFSDVFPFEVYERSDVYALGMTLYLWMNHREPFPVLNRKSMTLYHDFEKYRPSNWRGENANEVNTFIDALINSPTRLLE
jgi:serine/threonine protein kinase